MKSKKKLFLFLSIIMWLAGLGFLLMGIINKKMNLGLENSLIIFLGIIGVLCLILTVVFICLCLNCVVNDDEKLKIEENDERNKMIRGKTAEQSLLINSIIMLVIICILIIIREYTASFIVAVGTFIGSLIRIFLISYYQKKY